MYSKLRTFLDLYLGPNLLKKEVRMIVEMPREVPMGRTCVVGVDRLAQEIVG